MYPLWLCPFVLHPNPGMVHTAGDEPEMFMDIGAYGHPEEPEYESRKTTRRIEEFVRSVKG